MKRSGLKRRCFETGSVYEQYFSDEIIMSMLRDEYMKLQN